MRPADLLPDIEHRRLVALAFADHHGAVDVERVESLAHGFHRGGVGGFLVAATDQLAGGDRGSLGHADHFEHEDAVQRVVRYRVHWPFSPSRAFGEPSRLHVAGADSRKGWGMSRRRRAGLLGVMALLFAATPAIAQDAQTGTPPDRIDLTVTAPPLPSTEEACRRQREAAVVSGEIVVCGSVPGGQDQRITSREEAENRYAPRPRVFRRPTSPGPASFAGRRPLAASASRASSTAPNRPRCSWM